MEPLISVIIPVYNMERYLSRAVDSVISQSYKNLEIILVDDGSTDRSPEICDMYGKTDSRVKVIHKENGGLSSARNAGIDASSGEYISFVDSDDFVNINFISMLFNSCIKEGTDIAICNYKKVFFRGRDKACEKKSPTEIISGEEAALEIVDLDAGTYIPAWNKLYKREVFGDIRYPDGKYSEDFYISYKLLSNADKVSIIDEKLYGYVQRKESIIHSRDDISQYNFEALEEFDNYLKENVKEDSDRENLLNLSLKTSINNVVEDYYRAHKNGNKSRKEELLSLFKELKEKADSKDIILAPEVDLFAENPNRYIFERKIFEAMRSVKFFLVSIF